MFVTTEIYIQSTEEVAELVGSLEKILHVRFQPSLEPDVLSAFTDSEAIIEVNLERNYDDLSDVTPVDFQYPLNIVTKSNIPIRKEKGQIDYARELFQRLKETGRYPLLLLNNAEDILDEYMPEEN